jgi:hypothetical protein
MNGSMLLTFGPFLDRAREQNVAVSIFIGTHVVVGEVMSRDSRGVLILTGDGEMALLKLEAICAITSTAKNLTAMPSQEAG